MNKQTREESGQPSAFDKHSSSLKDDSVSKLNIVITLRFSLLSQIFHLRGIFLNKC